MPAQTLPVELTLPTPDQVIGTLNSDFENVDFQWKPVAGVSKYLVTVHDEVNDSLRRSFESGTSTQINLFVGHNFTWDVRPINGDMEGEPSTKGHFKMVRIEGKGIWSGNVFEINSNYLTEGSQSYSFGPGFSYVPSLSFSRIPNLVLSSSLGVQFAKDSGGNVFPIFEMVLRGRYGFKNFFYIEPGLGLGQAFQSQVQGGVFSIISWGVGIWPKDLFNMKNEIHWKKIFFERIFLRYENLFSTVQTQQYELGMAFTYGQ